MWPPCLCLCEVFLHGPCLSRVSAARCSEPRSETNRINVRQLRAVAHVPDTVLGCLLSRGGLICPLRTGAGIISHTWPVVDVDCWLEPPHVCGLPLHGLGLLKAGRERESQTDRDRDRQIDRHGGREGGRTLTSHTLSFPLCWINYDLRHLSLNSILGRPICRGRGIALRRGV